MVAEAARDVPGGRMIIEARAGQAPTSPFGGFAHVLPLGVSAAAPERVARELRTLAGDRGLVVVADDVHALDPPSAEVVRELLKAADVALLATEPAGAPSPLPDLPRLRLEPLADLAELLERVLGGPVDPASAARLSAAVSGDLVFLRELLRAGRSTGAMAAENGAWRWPGDLTVPDRLRDLLESRDLPDQPEDPPDGGLALEVALAAGFVLAGKPAGARRALEVLAQASIPDDDRARAGYTVARAQALAWGVGRAEDADRILEETAAAVRDPSARQGLLIQRAATELHRARCREALDGAADAKELVTPGPEAAAGVAVVESMAAALTGQFTAALEIARRALAAAAEWSIAVGREQVAALEFAAATASLATTDHLDAPSGPASPAAGDGDLVAWEAMRCRVLREQGRLRDALSTGWDGARRLRFQESLFAGPCLGELAQVAVMVGDLAAAREALAEAEQRALPALRALWFPVALARPWVLAAQGAMGAAVHDLLGVAAAAEELELRAYALTALHDVVRLGAAGVVADRLVRLAEEVDGEFAQLCAGHAVAAAAGDAMSLEAVATAFEGQGRPVLAAEVWAQAAVAQWDKQQAAAAGSRAWVLAQRCDHVRTPALGAAAQPDLTLIQYEIADQAAAGRSDREIAERMELPVRTVGEQIEVACARLGATGREELALLFGP